VAFSAAAAAGSALIGSGVRVCAVRKLAVLGVFIVAGCGSTTPTITKTVTSDSTGSGAAPATAGPVATFRVPSGSMEPTLRLGRLVTVSLDPAYVPKLGDIVVFHPPVGADPAAPICGKPNQGGGYLAACSTSTQQESSQTFIKRIVAGPGDTVAIRDGHVIRNGAREQDSTYTEPCGSDSSCTFPTAITIPQGDYFVLGDNRGFSDDSRFWGPVRRSWIVGVVTR
jgi:signal peptidase I